MRADLYWIDGSWPGRLAVAPRPRGGDWLEDEVALWKNAGVDVVVSLLTPDEVAALDLVREAEFTQAQGMRFISFPIEDRSSPRTREAAAEFVSGLVGLLVEGQNILIHCRQGVGRAPLIAVAVLVGLGLELDEVITRVGLARGCPVPETAEQRRWLTEFTRTVNPMLSR